jgi:hypothetical protein
VKAIPLGPRNVGYLESEIDDLIEALVAQRDAPAGAPEPALTFASVPPRKTGETASAK